MERFFLHHVFDMRRVQIQLQLVSLFKMICNIGAHNGWKGKRNAVSEVDSV